MRRTYCENQIEKPLKVCVFCKKQFYMHHDACPDCEDQYARRRFEADVRDISGNVMFEP